VATSRDTEARISRIEEESFFWSLAAAGTGFALAFTNEMVLEAGRYNGDIDLVSGAFCSADGRVILPLGGCTLVTRGFCCC
jgi:hypothetical protein